jgi:hypothetical protein
VLKDCPLTYENNRKSTKKADWTIIDEGILKVNHLNQFEERRREVVAEGFKHRYRIAAGGSSASKKKGGLGLFQSIQKFFETESIEISSEKHLPLHLFHF